MIVKMLEALGLVAAVIAILFFKGMGVKWTAKALAVVLLIGVGLYGLYEEHLSDMQWLIIAVAFFIWQRIGQVIEKLDEVKIAQQEIRDEIAMSRL